MQDEKLQDKINQPVSKVIERNRLKTVRQSVLATPPLSVTPGARPSDPWEPADSVLAEPGNTQGMKGSPGDLETSLWFLDPGRY